MNIISTIKQKITNLFNPGEETVDYPIYMTGNASVICKDKEGTVIKKVSIVPEHIDPDADIQLEFPRFSVIKVTSIEGLIGMHLKHVLVLDADDEPIEGSKALITSGTLYDIINNLQSQIDELKR